MMMGGRAHGTEDGRRRLPQLLLLSMLGFLVAFRAYASVDAPAPESEQQEYLYMMTAGNATFVPGGGDHDNRVRRLPTNLHDSHLYKYRHRRFLHRLPLSPRPPSLPKKLGHEDGLLS